MSRRVPLVRPEPNWDRYFVGFAPSAADWYQVGQLANWCMGRGAQLVPSTVVDVSISSGATWTFRFYVKPRITASQRIWNVRVRPTSTATRVEVAAPAGGTAIEYPAYTGPQAEPIVFTETIGTATATEQEISITVKAVGGTVSVEEISCYEQDRGLLLTSEDAGATGPDLETLLVRMPIMASSGGGLGNLIPLADNVEMDARRVGLFHMVTDSGISPWTRTTGSYLDMLATGFPVQGHKDIVANNHRVIRWAVYAKVAAGSGGFVKLTGSDGLYSEIKVTSTSFGWVTGSFTVPCDDMNVADGRFDDAWYTLMPSFKGDGVNQLSVASVSVWTSDAASWEPNELALGVSGLVGWFRPDSDLTNVISGEADTLTDHSGMGNHLAAPAAGNRVAWTATGFNGGSLPFLTGAAGNYLYRAAFDWDGDFSAFTIIMIGKAGGAAGQVALMYTPDAGTNFIALAANLAAAGTLDGFTDSSAISTTTNPSTDEAMYWFRWDGANKSIGTTITQEDSDADAHAAFVDDGEFSLFADTGGATNYTGTCADILVFNRALTNAEIYQVYYEYAKPRYNV